MITRNLLTLTIIAALPTVAVAENISGAMYTAPAHYDTNHPAPTTNATTPFGRVNIDTADQEHIATTAYVKGAYNSAIAAVNAVDARKQNYLFNFDSGETISSSVIGTINFVDYLKEDEILDVEGWEDRSLVTAEAVYDGIKSQRVEIYTTWDTNDTTDVAFKTVLPDD